MKTTKITKISLKAAKLATPRFGGNVRAQCYVMEVSQKSSFQNFFAAAASTAVTLGKLANKSCRVLQVSHQQCFTRTECNFSITLGLHLIAGAHHHCGRWEFLLRGAAVLASL